MQLVPTAREGRSAFLERRALPDRDLIARPLPGSPDWLDRPPAGQEYRCWVEVSGQRQNVGRMFFADDLAFWVGDTPAVSDVEPGTTFGVSLADLDSPSLDAPPVIVGEL